VRVWGLDPIQRVPAGVENRPVNTNRRIKVRLLRELVERGAYSVDPDAVAGAIVQLLSGADLDHEYAQAARKGGHRGSEPLAGVTSAVGADLTGTRLAA
jgi:hypothetical protein